MAPVALPDLSKGRQDIRAIASALAVKLAEANGGLAKSRAWYEGLAK